MRRLALSALALATLTACSGPLPAEFASSAPPAHGHAPVASASPSAGPSSAVSPSEGAPAVGDYNLADVMYLQMAIANHEQGIELVALATSRPVRPEVAELAAAIGSTQSSEVPQMRAWLSAWGHPATVDTNPDAHAHHGGMPLTDPEAIAELSRAPEGEFERKFVTVLTGHQHNAVEMARQELDDGVSPEVKAFADKVVRSRTGQISALLNFGAS